jgi:NTP pyrophosphatase (non-canonical NTP hydrolase)
MIEKYGVQKTIAFCELNAYKYRYRHDMKGGAEDLMKADWYRQKSKELDYNDPFYRLADRNSRDTVEQLLIEEMAELTQALSKYKRYRTGEKTMRGEEKTKTCYLSDVASEVADVILMTMQWAYKYGMADFVDQAINVKINRTLERMDSTNDKIR